MSRTVLPVISLACSALMISNTMSCSVYSALTALNNYRTGVASSLINVFFGSSQPGTPLQSSKIPFLNLRFSLLILLLLKYLCSIGTEPMINLICFSKYRAKEIDECQLLWGERCLVKA